VAIPVVKSGSGCGGFLALEGGRRQVREGGRGLVGRGVVVWTRGCECRRRGGGGSGGEGRCGSSVGGGRGSGGSGE